MQKMKRLQIENLGQINNADIEFGDLTLFVGPQATGKSIVSQLIKLLIDHEDIVYTIKKNGYDWEKILSILWNFTLAKGCAAYGVKRLKLL